MVFRRRWETFWSGMGVPETDTAAIPAWPVRKGGDPDAEDCQPRRSRYSPPVIRNVIFDWSGTLVDDLPAVWQATNHVLRQAGADEMTLEQFRAEFCLPFTRFYDRYTPHVPLPQLEAWFHGHFRGAQESVVALPHAREFLQFCRRHGLRTFLLSTVHREHFATQAARTGLGEFLDRPYVEVWDKRKKIHELLAENQLAPEETVFIGDMQHDVETARHGGIASCAVLTGYHGAAQLRACGPDLLVEHLGELRELLERHGLRLRPADANGQPATPAHPVATVGALIFNARGDVLLVRTPKWSGLWGIPGGKIKHGEPHEAALRRETREETGLELADIRFVLVQDCIDSPEFYRDAHFLLLNYTARCAGSEQVRLNEEAVEHRWVAPATARTLPLNTPTRVLLEHVLGRDS
jgi:phosphoglycolate phosphatase-like HAD superfamily hydrolase/ADP-ribose pyrophosphatase YjhB (NUDIX family)